MMDFDKFITLFKKFCVTKEEQKVIDDVYVRFLDQYRPIVDSRNMQMEKIRVFYDDSRNND